MADQATAAAASELAAVRESLERATRTFTERLARGGDEIERSRREAARAVAAAATPPRRAEPRPRQPPRPFAGVPAAAPTLRDGRAETEARRYLDEAKRRADRLIATMLAAVERETAAVRGEAEADAEARRRRGEAEAGAIVEEARAVAERIVAERQRRLGVLGDGIAGRAEALAAGLEDADRVREQFDAFARAIAAAADRIACDARPPALSERGAAAAAPP